MMKPAVEKTVGALIAIAFSITSAMAQSRSYTIQIESASSEVAAKTQVDKLRGQGLEAYFLRTEVTGVGSRYRVRIGKFNNQALAKSKANQLVSSGTIKEFIIAIYEAPAPGALPPRELDPVVSTQKKNPLASSESGSAPQRASLYTKSPATTSKADSPATNVKADSPATTAKTNIPVSLPSNLTINDHAWKVVRRGAESDKNLRAIYFLDARNGWVAGEAGVVYQTTDGGANWKPLPSAGETNIDFISFIDTIHGWMLGKPNARTGEQSDTVLFITSNGGSSWYRKPLPNITKICFTDAKNGWAAGRNSTLLKTADGGFTWDRIAGLNKLIEQPTDVLNYEFGYSDIRFTDPNHGWLIGNFYGRPANLIGGVFMTEDGGGSWRRIPLTIQSQHNSGKFTPGLMSTAHFNSARIGSITGEMYDGESRYFFALHTRDGGENWSLFRLPSRATHNSQFLDPERGVTAAATPRLAGKEGDIYDTNLLRTDNGGLSWRIEFIARANHIRGIFFLSQALGWAVGDKGIILAYEEKSKQN